MEKKPACQEPEERVKEKKISGRTKRSKVFNQFVDIED